MAEDRAADVLTDMDEGDALAIRAELPAPVVASIDTLLRWPPDSAGGMMTTEYVASSADATVAEVLAHIRTVERSRETVYSVFLLEPQGPGRHRLAAPADRRRADIARDRPGAGHDPITVARAPTARRWRI